MKNTILLFALSLITFVQIQAQTTFALVENDAKIEKTYKVTDATKTAEAAKANFKKVENAVIQKLKSQVKYPDLAYEYNVEGTVLVQFTFDGKINNVKVKNSVGAGCDKAALKAVQNFPKLYQEMGGKFIEPIEITIPFVFEM